MNCALSVPIRRPRGFTLISAIVILVVLAAFGAAIMALSATQHVGSALDIEGARAYQAARSGMEWGLYQRLEAPTRNAYCANPDSPDVSFGFPGTVLAGFTVTVQCSLQQSLQQDSHPVSWRAGATITQISSAGTVASVRPATAGAVEVGMQVRITETESYNGIYSVDAIDTANDSFRIQLTRPDPTRPYPPEEHGIYETRSQALDRRQIIATACNQPVEGRICPNPSPTNSMYVQRVVQVEF